MNNYGERVRQKRKELGLTQTDLAAKVGYRDKSAISKVEIGERDIPLFKLKELATVLGTTVSWLMGMDEVDGRFMDENIPVRENETDIAGGGKVSLISPDNTPRADYCIVNHGDMFVSSGILDGDVLMIKETSIVINGDIAVVWTGAETLVRKVYYDGGKKNLVLMADNMPPIVMDDTMIGRTVIKGRVVAFQRAL